jgi:hypothetical protein
VSIVDGYTLEAMVGDLDDHRPETRWALLVDPGGPAGRVDTFAVIREQIGPGDRIPLHVHRDDEVVIVHGDGRYRLGDEERDVTDGAIDALMEKYPNLYGDLSAGSGATAISRDPKFGREFLIRRAGRLMFGTDFLSPGQEVPQLALYRQLDLPAEVQARIFRDNARRVMQL